MWCTKQTGWRTGHDHVKLGPGNPSDDGREDLTDRDQRLERDGNVSSASAYGAPGKNGVSRRFMARYRCLGRWAGVIFPREDLYREM